MKMRYFPFWSIAFILGSAASTYARDSFQLSIRTPWVGAYYGSRYVPSYYYPYWEHNHYYRPYPHQAYAYPPAVAVTPVYVAPVPVVTAPTAPSVGLSGDYGTDLAQLNEKLSRLRSMLQRQNEKGAFTKEQYVRFMDELDRVEHDEHERAYDHGGNLTPDDFTDLYRRVNQTGEDIELALAQ